MDKDKKLRSVNTKFWDDAYVIDLDPIEKLIFLYFLTNPLCNLIGIYEITLRRIAFDTGIDKDMILKILDRFDRDKKIYYKDNFIILPNFTKNQKYNANMIKGCNDRLNSLPNNIKRFIKDFESFKMLPNDYLIIRNDYQTIRKEEDEDEIEEEKKRKKEFDLSFVDDKFKIIFSEWLKYKKDRRETYKSEKALKACYKKLVNMSDNDPQIAMAIIESAMANNYAGFFRIDNIDKKHSIEPQGYVLKSNIPEGAV